VWARSAAAGDDQKINMEFVLLNTGNAMTGSKVDNYSLKKVVIGNSYQQFAMVRAQHQDRWPHVQPPRNEV
jgi:hypothetical protein